MLFELRTITCQPSAVGRVVTAAAEIRADQDNSTLEGAWLAETGALGRLMELRKPSDADLTTPTVGLAERHPELRDAIIGVESSLLAPIFPFEPANGAGHVYELRRYRTRPGTFDEWLGHFVSVMPARKRYSVPIGLWRSVGGSPDEISHLWVYEGLDQRAAIRARVMQDPEWQAFLKVGAPLLVEMNSIILIPTRYSPLQ